MHDGGWPLAAAAALVVLGTGCSPDGERQAPYDRLGFEACLLPMMSQPARCGQITVPENRAAGDGGRMLALRVAILPARCRHAEPDPLVLLAGGPGQAATEAWGPAQAAFEALGADRDIVLVDQRGTGQSAPLDCDTHRGDLGWLFAEDTYGPLVHECLGSLDADLRYYTTPIAAEDLEQVRLALGYERLNLIGGSYGTRLALEYLRRYPEAVRSVVLDGVAPAWMALPLPAALDSQNAWDALVADCQADPACREAFPQLDADFDALLAELGRHPAEVELDHPRTGRAQSFRVGRAAFAGGVQGVLYSVELTSLLPYAIAEAKAHHFDPWVALVVLLSDSIAEQLSMGLFFSVVCTEDVSRYDEAKMAAVRGTFVGDRPARDLLRACADWPRGELPADYWEPTYPDRPTLVLSGALDPVTPPRWGEQVAERLPSARHVIVPAVGHGTLVRGCVPRLVEQFVREGSSADLAVDCVDSLHRPPFFIDAAGPEP